MPRIVLLGGYGAVGLHAATALARWYPGGVVLAGRSLGKARTAARRVPGTVPLRVDLADARADARTVDGADAVLMCAEQHNARVAEACLRRGVHYVDVSADHERLAAVAELRPVARTHGATAVLSVGLVPGVSNLLAAAVAAHAPGRALSTGVLLGSGEQHGAAALEWTLDGLTGTGQGAEPQPGAGAGARTDAAWQAPFPRPYGPRTVHPFPFSDQHTLPHTLGVPAARTGLCLDSRPLTALLPLARRPSAVRLLGRPRVRAGVLAALRRVHVGGDGFAVTVSAGHTTASFSGRVQSRASGLAAALVVRRLLTPPSPAPGVHHLDQLAEPAAFLTELATHGFTLDLPEDSPS